MEVTVGGMDAAVEPSGMSSWRVTGMRVLNCKDGLIASKKSKKSKDIHIFLRLKMNICPDVST